MTGFVASWRTALRIARREVRRAKGRSALVVGMVALPVVALSFVAASYDMATLTGAEKADRTMGTADARIEWPGHRPVLQMPDPAEGYDGAEPVPGPAGQRGEPGEPDRPGTEAELRAALPPGSTTLPVRDGTVAVTTPAGLADSEAVMVDAASPLTRGYVEVLDGRAPATATEVALTEHARAWLNSSIGATVTVLAGQSTREYTVVGRVEFPSRLDRVLLFADAADDAAIGEWFSVRRQSWLVDTPAPIDWERVRELNEQGMLVAARAVFEDPPPDEAVPLIQRWRTAGLSVGAESLATGVLIAGLALLEVVLLAGPAFAVGVRRRQRLLALVAANGGTPAHVRRIVLADGVVLGVLGAAAGVALGIAAAFAGRPLVEELLVHARVGGYRVFPEALVAIAGLAVVTGLLAAMVPAFVAARQNVVASLAARRGATRSRKRWIAVGFVMVGVGAAVTAAGAAWVNTTVLLAGLVLAELGLVVCTPALVGLVARVGRVLPLAPRIALRDAARNRAAAAPAISAVMAAAAGSVTIGMIMHSDREHLHATWYQDLPTGSVTVFVSDGQQPADPVRVEQVEQTVRSVLPISELHRVGHPGCPPGAGIDSYCAMQPIYNDLCPQLKQWIFGELSDAERESAAANPNCDVRAAFALGGNVVVDDGSAVATLTGATGEDLRRARQTLASGGVVVRSPLQITEGEVTLAVVRPDPDAPADPAAGRASGPGGIPVLPGHSVTTLTVPGYLLSTGLGPGTAIVSPALVQQAGLTVGAEEIVAATSQQPSEEELERFFAATRALNIYGNVQSGPPGRVDPMLLLLAGVAGLITLGAAGIGTGLASAEGRADLSTLAAVGASPRLRRRLSVCQAWVIAGLGSVLGGLAGIGAAYAVIAGNNQQPWQRLWPSTPIEPVVPWPTLGVVLVAVPVVAILGAGLFTRSRLPVERRS